MFPLAIMGDLAERAKALKADTDKTVADFKAQLNRIEELLLKIDSKLEKQNE